MNYVSAELSAIQMLDPQRHELALLQDAFLNKGGTIEVLQGPSFVPPPIRHEPPPRKKVAKPAKQAVAETPFIDKITLRDIEREERVAQRAKDKAELIERIRKLAVDMTQGEAMAHTGLDRRKLHSIAKENGFSFKKSSYVPTSNLRPWIPDEAKEAKNAERIKAFKELGLTRNQATEKLGVNYRAFSRLLEKFGIDYPKTARGGVRPAFFPKNKEASQ
ncbi:hypothetical protein [Pseudomonas sp. URMO17WK12:I12]|uniref:hypothetical protein n=1 Tax=Pseudomonas sp. URMO17WK12:I12 TaxID=1259797 RepID=UPI000489F2FF|nr:hypothetical protein [Pseudomonas sp. URMO17WK12:I12]